MTRDPAQSFTRGFFALLAAAFVLLAGFVVLVLAVLDPSPVRLGVAVGLLAVGAWLVSFGMAQLRQAAGRHEEHAVRGRAQESTTETNGTSGSSSGDEREDPVGP